MGQGGRNGWKETAAAGMEIVASAVGQAAQVDSLLGNDFGKYDTVFSAGDAYSEQRKTNDEDDARKLNAGTKLRMVMEMERLRDAARGGSTDRALRQAAKELQQSYKNIGSGGFLDRQFNQRFRDASRELWECLKLEAARRNGRPVRLSVPGSRRSGRNVRLKRSASRRNGRLVRLSVPGSKRNTKRVRLNENARTHGGRPNTRHDRLNAYASKRNIRPVKQRPAVAVVDKPGVFLIRSGLGAESRLRAGSEGSAVRQRRRP